MSKRTPLPPPRCPYCEFPLLQEENGKLFCDCVKARRVRRKLEQPTQNSSSWTGAIWEGTLDDPTQNTETK